MDASWLLMVAGAAMTILLVWLLRPRLQDIAFRCGRKSSTRDGGNWRMTRTCALVLVWPLLLFSLGALRALDMDAFGSAAEFIVWALFSLAVAFICAMLTTVAHGEAIERGNMTRQYAN